MSYTFRVIYSALFLTLSFSLSAQIEKDKISSFFSKKPNDTLLSNYRNYFLEELKKCGLNPKIDSTFFSAPKIQVPRIPQIKKTSLLGKKDVLVSKKALFKLGRGSITYNWNYRSSIDTPIVENDISQHMATANFNATIAQKIPIQIFYFERQSNSNFFRDVRDFRIQFDVQTFHGMAMDGFRKKMDDFSSKLTNPVTKIGLDASINKVNEIDSWLKCPIVTKKYIDCKVKAIEPSLLDTIPFDKRDSALNGAKKFISMYESLLLQKEKYQNLADSFQAEYIRELKKVKKFQQLRNGGFADKDNIREIKEILQEHGGDDNHLKKITSQLGAVRTLAVGRTLPNFSNLTLKNTNIRGLNFEYNRNNLYLAAALGVVDFRVRDFVNDKQRKSGQFIYSGRIGYGRKEGSNIILTYFEGRKLLYASSSVNKAQLIKGISVATQFLIEKNHRLNLEYAQSAAPSMVNVRSIGAEKSQFNFSDKSKRAYSVQVKSYFPTTRTKFEGMYQYSGHNFQNFTNYRVNASANSWYVKAEQYFWKRVLQVVASVRKNDFTNPFVLQRYEANTVFKNITATFRKRNWPALSIGYMPSSQYTIVDSVVYENRFQVLNGSISHRYKIGTASSSSSFIYNRFYNNSSDTGFVYYNSNNFFFSQTFQFLYYTANLNITHSTNGYYTLDVFDAGFLFKVLNENAIGAGIKINHLNTEAVTKIGLYGNGRLQIQKLGQITFWFEKTYLPTINHSLFKSDLYNIGFIRYLN